MNYILLKDLPGVKAGMIFTPNGDVYNIPGHGYYSSDYFNKHLDFFAPAPNDDYSELQAQLQEANEKLTESINTTQKYEALYNTAVKELREANENIAAKERCIKELNSIIKDKDWQITIARANSYKEGMNSNHPTSGKWSDQDMLDYLAYHAMDMWNMQETLNKFKQIKENATTNKH